MSSIPRQPNRIYGRGPRIGGGLSSFARGFGRAGGALLREFTKPGPSKQQKGSGNLSSPYFNKKNPLMQLKRINSFIGGMGLPKNKKALLEVQFENETSDPNIKDDKDFSRREGDKTIEKARHFFGDVVAKDVAVKLQRAFLGNSTISSKKADEQLSSIGGRYGPDVLRTIREIAAGYGPAEYQGGRERKYITGGKFANVLKKTEAERSGTYTGQVLRKTFKVSETQGGSTPKASSRIVGLQEGLLGWSRKTDNDTKNDNK
jgi:hypothetical protein